MSMNRKGFTIVELLIVIVVIAILAAISIVAYNGVQERATSSALRAEMSQLQRTIQTDLLQQGGDAVAISAPLAYVTEPGHGNLLAEPIENGHEITLYVVFDTNNNQSASWNGIAALTPAGSQKFNIRTSGPGNGTVNASYTTSAQNDLSIAQSGIRNTTGRHVGWHTASTDVVEAGFNTSSRSGSRNPATHDGWNFTNVVLYTPAGVSGVATLVFDEYHDEATRRGILQWLDQEYNIDRLN